MQKEFINPAEYFPYIGHTINHMKQIKNWMYKRSIGGLFSPEKMQKNGENQLTLVNAHPGLFQKVEINGLAPHLAIARNPEATEVIVPRHRTLFDYSIGQPVHHNLVNQEVMLLAGNNLFISFFDYLLRIFGALMFLREDLELKRKGYPRVFLSQERYLSEVFPAYLRQQMIDGVMENNRTMRRDLIMYPEQEKHPVTRKRGGGRSKSGKLRNLSHILFDRLKDITRDTPVKLYVSAVNISFSKIPEVLFIVYPNTKNNLRKKTGYLLEQFFVYHSYPKYCCTHPEAMLDVIINYGKPQQLVSTDFQSSRDLLHFTKELRHNIGRLESIFPIQFLYRVLDENQDLSLREVESRAKKLYDYYLTLNINLDRISGKQGEMMSVKSLIDQSILALNAHPGFHVREFEKIRFLSFRNNRLYSHDDSVHAWYANNLRHLDE